MSIPLTPGFGVSVPVKRRLRSVPRRSKDSGEKLVVKEPDRKKWWESVLRKPSE